MTITIPGVYDLPADEYHADPVPDGSLSPTRAKVLLEDAGPARFRFQQDSPRRHSSAFDWGRLLHGLILGDGEPVEVLEFDSYRTKAAQQARDEARNNGHTPILRDDYGRAEHIAQQVRNNPTVRRLLAHGEPEQSMFWRHPSGVMLRGRPDWIDIDNGLIVDVKTTSKVGPRRFATSAFNFGYHMQAAWYLELAQQLGHDVTRFLHIVIENDAPNLSFVAEMTDDYLQLGRDAMTAAIDLYRTAVETGDWPGYPDEVIPLLPPDWALDDEIEF